MWVFDMQKPEDRAVIEAARSFGVAPTVFLGRETGPPWIDADRTAVLDLMSWESQLCPGCRQPLAETTAAANEFRYRAHVQFRCHRCTALDIASNAAQSHPHPSALHLGVALREPVDSA